MKCIKPGRPFGFNIARAKENYLVDIRAGGTHIQIALTAKTLLSLADHIISNVDDEPESKGAECQESNT